MKPRSILLTLGCASTIALAGCSAGDYDSTPTVTTDAATSSRETTTEPSTPSSSPAPIGADTAEPATEPQIASPAAPTFVSCWENNAALMSDGSVIVDTINCSFSSTSENAPVDYGPGNLPPTTDPSGLLDGTINGQVHPQMWWSQCLAVNTLEYCGANDPY